MVNHFPGMAGVTKKNQLAASLKRIKQMFPVDFTFYPKTWCLPAQLSKLRKDMANEREEKGKNSVYIVKPSDAAQGRGIFFINDFEKLQRMLPNEAVSSLKANGAAGAHVV